jgi:hypothetical protein
MDDTKTSSSAADMENEENKMPLNPSPSKKPAAKRRNIILEKFKADITPPLGKIPYTSFPFFFYGSLTNPAILQEILQLPEPPMLNPPRVPSRKIMLWGQHPALVDAPFGSFVDDMGYVVETEDQTNKLEDYETTAYRLEGIRITIEGKYFAGRTFMWAGDPEELEEGT